MNRDVTCQKISKSLPEEIQKELERFLKKGQTFLNLIKFIKPQIQKAQQIPSRIKLQNQIPEDH